MVSEKMSDMCANMKASEFKPIFLGTVDPNSEMSKWTRVVNTQKCIRAGGKHNDLDDVGKDVYHHTFFEMLGNWSFGDYFKKEICTWAWEFLTEDLNLSKDRLYVSYFGGNASLGLDPDLEAKEIWLNLGVDKSRIIPGTMSDNFWEMGETGPCGPCSEIHFDRIGGRDAADLVNKDDPDVLEIWNLVFMTYNRESDGTLKYLPKKHIDCGLGLERLVSVVQEKRSNYDTDLFVPLFDAIQKGTSMQAYSGKVGVEDKEGIDMAYRVVADHIRTLTIALSDGGRPDNVGRGYVLRRILRRGVRYATEKLKAKPGFFGSLVHVVVDILGDTFSEIKKDPETIISIIDEEERQFLKTLSRGKSLLERTVAKLGDSKVLPGNIAWRLYDTYGFPFDLTQLMCEERGLTVDQAVYEESKKEAQRLSQGKGSGIEDTISFDVHSITELQDKMKLPPTDDSSKYSYQVRDNDAGVYEFGSCTAKVVALRANKQFVNEVTSGEECGVLLDRTCFYAEAGGQIYDTGFITKQEDDGTECMVNNVQVRGGYVLHICKTEGKLQVGDAVNLSIDTERRRLIMANHTGTHILNFALMKTLGDEVDQKGSLVAPDRLRFDFSKKSAMTTKQILETELKSQEVIKQNNEIYFKDSNLSTAKSIQGLRAVFGETYPDPVRVVSIGVPVEKLEADPNSPIGLSTSIEFCGGTHLHNSSHVGDFVIASEEAIAKGIRRIVALTGPEATKAIKKADRLLVNISELVEEAAVTQSPKETWKKVVDVTDEVSQAIIPYWRKEEMRNSLKVLKKSLDDRERAARAAISAAAVEASKKIAQENKGVPFLVRALHAFNDSKALDGALKAVKVISPSTAAMFLSVDPDTNKILALCSSSKKDLPANEWIASITPVICGKGGGRAESAQATGTNGGCMDQAIATANQFAKMKLKIDLDTVGDKMENLRIDHSSEKIVKEIKNLNIGEGPEVELHVVTGSLWDIFCEAVASYSEKKVKIVKDLTSSSLLKLKNGSEIVTHNGIAFYLASKSLKGDGNLIAESKILEWTLLAEKEFWPAVAGSLLDNKRAKDELHKLLKMLNEYLLPRTYLVTEFITIADLALATSLFSVLKKETEIGEKFKNVRRWLNTILHQPEVKNLF
ncbi:hypothetical protein QYM36_002215 [Artemia franciscana]|uniref:Alanine--tRNA ligase n=1 Tax=Artemia franciscana TaxID=6661 RepID=A0AA88LJ75_ARTSF|nr:hypothetical protein QYM36_002215 [Artemia franciscana]